MELRPLLPLLLLPLCCLAALGPYRDVTPPAAAPPPPVDELHHGSDHQDGEAVLSLPILEEVDGSADGGRRVDHQPRTPSPASLQEVVDGNSPRFEKSPASFPVLEDALNATASGTTGTGSDSGLHARTADPTDRASLSPRLPYRHSALPGERWFNTTSQQVKVGEVSVSVDRTEDMERKNNASTREKRSQDDPFAPPSDICEVTEGELTQLANALHRASEELASSGNSDNARNSGGLCPSIVSYIHNTANYIVQQAKLIKQLQQVDINMYEALKRENEEQLVAVNKKIDNLIKTFNQEKSAVTDKLNTELANFKRRLASAFEEIYTLRGTNQAKTVKLCASQIKNKEYQTALTEFLSLNDDSQLVAIVQLAYDSNVHNFEKVLEFAKILPKCTQDGIVYPALFDVMKTNSHLNSPKMTVFLDSLQSCPLTLSGLKAQIIPHVNNVIDAWATQIRSGDYKQLILHVKDSVNSANSVNIHMDSVIGNAYANNLVNFNNVFNFLKELPWLSQQCKGFESLLNVMRSNNHVHCSEMVALAYKTKQAESSEHAGELRDSFERLKAAFPPVIRNLIWNGVCTIRNTHVNEYMYAAGPAHKTELGDRRVFTWIKGGPVLEGDWKFVPIDAAASLYNIVNNKWNDNDYLGQDRFNAYDSERTTVVSCSKYSLYRNLEWRVEPVERDGAKYFTIKNSYGGMHLYASSSYFNYDSYRRTVFSWTRGNSVIEGYWDINCE